MKNMTLLELIHRYPDNASARAWFEKQRWVNGIPDICVLCDTAIQFYTFRSRPGVFRCKECTGEFTVRTGTLLERSHIPLHKWMFALWLFSTHKQGITSIQLSKQIGVTQKSAWFMLHRLRSHCATDMVGREGFFEADETYIGGLEKNRHAKKKKRLGRGTVGKTPVLGLYCRTTGQVSAKVIKNTTATTIQGWLTPQMHPENSYIATDEHKSYIGLDRHYYVNHSQGQYVKNEMIYTNSIESFWSVLSRCLKTYVSVSVKHLQKYVNEACFRQNHKDHTIMEHMQALAHTLVGKRLTYTELTRNDQPKTNKGHELLTRLFKKYTWLEAELNELGVLGKYYARFE